MTLHSFAHKASKFASDNSPMILTALGVAGTVGTAFLSGKAAVKAYQVIDADERIGGTHGDPVQRFKERARYTWKYFIPPAISLVGTATCIICANRIGTKRAAALAAAYSLSERAYSEYKDKVVETFGKAKEQKVRDAVAQDRLDREPTGKLNIFAVGDGPDLCFELFTGRYFYSSMENIKHAVNRTNQKINNHYEASLNDFYDYLGLDHNKIGEELGWNTDKLLEVTFSSGMADGDRPCLVFDYMAEPRRGYFRFA